jgi:hypothetical protein
MDMEAYIREQEGGKCKMVYGNSVDGDVGSGRSGGKIGATSTAGHE